ncbi:MAG: DUF1501 domain-containing protein [Planctomycetaceae bacterium]|nr:DUF1501 domain-containing protein [Planctomycetaceae bacterium]
MLNLLPRSIKTCAGVSRRSFLQVGTLGGVGLSLPAFFAAKRAAAATTTKTASKSGSAVNCIVIWTQGGTSHHDTFDPKPQAPLSIKGEFGVIDTAVPGVQFAEVVPRMAQELNRFALLRSWNPLNGSHGTADQYVLSGRKVNPAIHYPTMGSVVSHQFGFKTAMPPYIQLGNAVDKRFGGASPGILGLEHGAFDVLNDPNATNFTVRDITPPNGMGVDRVDRRKKMLSTVDALQRPSSLQPQAYDALDEHYATALNMITAPETRQAFQIDKEDPKLRDAYGRNRFGQSCLLARRLIEAGVRFVTLTDGGWDTHQDNFKSLKNSRMPPIDRALPQLLMDLEQRGLLDSTLVVWLTDFGRTPIINSASGRDHWASAGFAIMAGAGIPGGSVLGATDDEGGKPVKNEYFSEDLVATIYHKLGLPTDLHVYAPDGRPVQLLDGRVIHEWV